MKRSRPLIISSVLIAIFLITPAAIGFIGYDTIKKLRISNATITVTRVGWTIGVKLSFLVENPTDFPLPSFTGLVNVRLGGHTLFLDEVFTEGLGAHQTSTVILRMTVDFGLVADLFWVLVDYLGGSPVSYLLEIAFSIDLVLFEFDVFTIEESGVWELY